MNLTISPANTQDIPALLQLLEILFTQEAEFQPDKKVQIKGLESILADEEKGFILVAREGKNIVGMVNVLFTVSTALGGRVALLEDMVVSPTARKNGIGSRLLQEALNLAKTKECLRVTLLTDSDNHAAHQFYGKNGFMKSSMAVFRQMFT